jgi:hypothetical protein
MTETPDTLVAVNDLDQFVQLLSSWHKKKIATLKHMLEIPDTAEVSLGDAPPIKMTGAFREGFLLGLSLSISELGELPFVAEIEDSSTAVKH